MDDTIDSDAFWYFLEETADSCAALGSRIVRLETDAAPKELLEEIFRPVHSIKGNAGFFELNNLVQISHKLEDLLQDLRSDKLAVTKEAIDILVEGINILIAAVKRVENDPSAKDLTEQQKEYIEKIVAYRSQEIAFLDLTEALRALTEGLSELAQHGIDMNTLPHAKQVRESVSLLVEDIREKLGKDLQEESDVRGSFFLRGRDFTDQTYILFDVLKRLKKKTDIPLQLSERFTASFHEICNALDASQQKKIDLEKVEHLFRFLDDSYLNQTDDFIQEIDQAVSAVVQYLENHESPGEVRKIGEILVDNGTITEQDLANTLSRQKPLGQLLLEDKKIQEEDLAEALAQQSSEAIDILRKKEKASKDVKTIRINQGKIDEFVFLVGGLITNLDTLNFIQKELAQKYFEEGAVRALKRLLVTLNNMASDLENSIMEIRKVPARFVLQKLPSLARSLSQNLGKRINTEIMGDDILVDKDIIEKIENPLVHLIRNSVDHGIEATSEERISKGKPEEGTITVFSWVDREGVYIDVADDGQGIDPEKIRGIARQKGFLKEHELSKLNDQEAMNLIFNPGFSSAKKVSDISGRGVGLDVVKKNVEELGGSVIVDSQVGKGTKFHIKLPLTKTLVTKEALFIEDHGNIFAVPSAEVECVVDLNGSQLKDHKEYLTAVIKDKVYFLIRLNDCINLTYGYDKSASEDKCSERTCGLILKNQRRGLLVEKILDFTKIVVQDFEDKYLDNTPMMEGFTIRGDGRVVMVLNFEQMLSAN